jgi:hypothetical protein
MLSYLRLLQILSILSAILFLAISLVFGTGGKAIIVLLALILSAAAIEVAIKAKKMNSAMPTNSFILYILGCVLGSLGYLYGAYELGVKGNVNLDTGTSSGFDVAFFIPGFIIALIVTFSLIIVGYTIQKTGKSPNQK